LVLNRGWPRFGGITKKGKLFSAAELSSYQTRGKAEIQAGTEGETYAVAGEGSQNEREDEGGKGKVTVINFRHLPSKKRRR